MKTLQLVACTLVLSLAVAVHAADPPSPELQALLTEGQTAYVHGDLAKAKAAFETVYQIDSRNTVAISYLKRIIADEKTKPKNVDQEKALASLIIPKVELRDATLREALDFLRKKVTDLSGGKQSVNFVIPIGEPTDSTRVTLSLQSVPFPEAVRYIGRVANFDFTYEKYAIVGKPGTGANPQAQSNILQGAKGATTPPAQ